MFIFVNVSIFYIYFVATYLGYFFTKIAIEFHICIYYYVGVVKHH